MDLGDDRCSRDTEKVPVGLCGRNNPAPEIAGVDMVRNHKARGFNHRQGHSTHREPGRLENVDAIDFSGADLANGPTDAPIKQPIETCLPLFRAQQLGILDTDVHGYRLEPGGTGHNRTGQRAAADLIDADDGVKFSQQLSVS